MESDMIVVIFLAEGEPVLIDVGMLNTLDDATVGEIGVALKHILMVDNQLIEYGRTIDMDRTAGDGAVRIEFDVAILAYDSTLEELEQKAVGILHILADERSVGKIIEQGKESRAYTRSRVGMGATLITYCGEHLT